MVDQLIMKTTFETEEDLKFLYDLLSIGILHSEKIIGHPFLSECSDYIDTVKKFQSKCCEYLEIEEPNDNVVCNFLKCMLLEQFTKK